MNARQSAHPTHDHLKAYGLGEAIEPAAAETIGQHLETCADCRRVVAGLSADPFLDRLRAVRTPDGTPAPEGPMDGLARSITRPCTPSVAAAAGEKLPPELADHPNYEVLRELGRGGMGVVYLARNRLMDRPEVLKVMSKELVNKPGAADRFSREMRSAAKLAHPNVVRAYSADCLGDSLMFAMEYVEGDDLAGLVKARGPLPVLNACYYAQQAAAGLQHAFEHEMVHRDIKPANLILARAGRKHTVKVLDFGLAKVRGGGGELTGVGAMMGTPSYMAPEQWRDAASADIRADIYSLGCTLYFLLTGRPPFEGDWTELLWKHQQGEPAPLTRVRPGVPEELAAVVAKMMAKDPAARYQTPAEVAKALTPFVKSGTAKPAPTAGTVPPEAKSTAAVASAAAPTHPNSRPAWETIGEVSVSPVLDLPPPPRPARKRPQLWPAVACGTILVAILVALAWGVFVKTKDGILELDELPADAVVLVDGERVTVTWDAGKQSAEVRVKPGTRTVEVRQGDTLLRGESVEIAKGERRVLAVRVKKEDPPIAKTDPPDVKSDQPEERFDLSDEPTILYQLRHQMNNQSPVTYRLRSDGWIIGPAGAKRGLWALGPAGRRLILWWDTNDPRARNGQWIEDIGSADGIDFEGSNNDTAAPPRIRGHLTAAADAKRGPARQKALAAAFKFDGSWHCRFLKGAKGVRTVNGAVVDTPSGAKCTWKQEGDTITVTWPTGGEERLTIVGPDALTGENKSGDRVVWVRQP